MKDDGARVIPPMLYVPIAEAVTDRPPEVLIGTDESGRAVIAAFTALDRLLTKMGPQQAWAVMPTDDVVTGIRNGVAERIILDPATEIAS